MTEDLAVLLAERECERLNHRYALFADRGEASRIGELFTEDGVFETPGMVLRGPDEIRRTLLTRQRLTTLRTLHQLTGIHVDLNGPDTATGWTTLSLHRCVAADDTRPATRTQPVLLGHYEDSYRRVDGTWLIAHRRQHVLFADPADPEWDVSRGPGPV